MGKCFAMNHVLGQSWKSAKNEKCLWAHRNVCVCPSGFQGSAGCMKKGESSVLCYLFVLHYLN